MRHTVLGCPVDDVTVEELLESVGRSLTNGFQQWYTSINVANWYAYTRQSKIAGMIDQASLISADGWPICVASRVLYGINIPRVPAMTFFEAVCRTFGSHPLRVYLLGGRPGVAELAGARLQADHPGLHVVGCHHGYLTGSHEQEEILSKIQESAPDLLILGMGTPYEQSWLTEYLSRCPVRFALGIGGGMDIIAGLNHRAPVWMQRLGLEWAFRMAQEPGRLGPRYLTTSLAFVGAFARVVVERALHPKTASQRQSEEPISTKKGA